MLNYKTFLLFPVFKNNKFCQNIIFNPENLISRSTETRSLVDALDSYIIIEKIINITIPKPSALFSMNVIDDIIDNNNLENIDLIIIDCSLTPVQHRNLEKLFNKKVIDRTQLIIEIFGLRAKSKEGKLQVELANQTFQKTRLVRSWTHLERQRGGLSKVGGPGESQIELDKRMINLKIKQIKKQLVKVKQTRNIQRKRRKENSIPIFSLVGYTNSGKSTIFNKLSLSDVLVKDMVFATLDTKMSSVNLGNKNQIILTDTVGFISALPTELINSFNSSLEELFSADFLLLVHDLSNPNIENQAHLVLETLKDIGFSEEELNQKIINIFNKSDIVSDIPDINTINKNKSIKISAFKGFGLEDLKNYMANEIITVSYLLDIFVPISFPDIYSWLFKNTYILSETNENINFEGSKIRVDISSYQLNIFQGNYPNIKVNFI